jgi:allantoinase
MSLPRPNVVRPPSAAEAGYDHDWFPYTPLPARPRRPSGLTGLALCIIVDVRAAEWENAAPAVGVPGGRGQAPYPDFPRMSHREFGHRAGLFRLSAILRDGGLPWAAAVDVLTAEHYPRVLSLVQDEAAEILAGGLSASRAITSLMSEPEEDHYIRQTLDRLERTLGSRPRGWLSPQGSESFRTPGVLARNGVDYLADWANDEQPYAVTGAGELWSLPVSWELSDLSSMFVRGVSPNAYARAVLEAVDVLVADSTRSPRMLCLHLHPWLSGEPFRARAVRELVAQLASRTDVWWTTPAAIVDHDRNGQQ